jgi:hypothetical protein
MRYQRCFLCAGQSNELKKCAGNKKPVLFCGFMLYYKENGKKSLIFTMMHDSIDLTKLHKHKIIGIIV